MPTVPDVTNVMTPLSVSWLCPTIWGGALLSAVLIIATPAATEDWETFGLPDAPGREEVLIYCGACHSMALVVQQGLTRAQWADALDWMYEEQGMAVLEPEVETLVLDYLGTHVDPAGQKNRLRARGVLP